MTEAKKRYYEKNKEKIKEYHRRWYQENKEFLSRKRRKQNVNRWKVLYSVWDNYTDAVVIVDGNAIECAKAMGISEKSFYSIRTRTRQGKMNKWTIEQRKVEKNDG